MHRMWEIREGYDHDYRMGKRDEVKDAYECGYEDGYKDAMEEIESHKMTSYKSRMRYR